MTSPRIQPKAVRFVKTIASLSLVAIAWIAMAAIVRAVPPPYSQDVTFPPRLPRIAAKSYNVKVISSSRTRMMYLLEDDSPERPRVGKIILLKEGEVPVMAFRVLKTYPGKRRFVGRRVRRYRDYRTLAPGSTFQVIEKLSNLDLPPPTAVLPTPIEKKEIRELEQTPTPEVARSTEGSPRVVTPAPPEAPPLVPTAPDPIVSAPPVVPPDEIAEAQPTEPEHDPESEAPLDELDQALAQKKTPPPEPQPEPDSEPEQDPEADGQLDELDQALAQKKPSASEEVTEDVNDPEADADLNDLEGALSAKAAPKDDAPPSEEPAPDDTASSDSPAEDSTPEPRTDDDDSSDVDDDELEIREVDALDNHRQGLSAEVGYIANYSSGGARAAFTGAGMRYSLKLVHMMFASSRNTQDSITAEGGVFLYKVLRYTDQGDSYTVMPLIATGRYTLLLSENYGIFGYAGMLYNYVLNSLGDTTDSVGARQLTSLIPAMGGGMIFRVGPGWEARVSFGLDMTAFGIVLRF